MTDPVAIAIIGALAGVPATIGGVLAAWFSYRASTHAKEAADTAKSVEHNTDGIKAELVTLTAKSSHAEGVLDEKNRAEGKASNVERTISSEAQKPGEAK